MKRILFLLCLLSLFFCNVTRALEPDEVLQNPVLEQRARVISQSLRCLVCQGETVEASSTPFAHDVRMLIRKRLQAGDTDTEITAAVTSRYGDSILLKPPFKPETLVLWLGPIFIFIGGGIPILLFLRKQSLNKKEKI